MAAKSFFVQNDNESKWSVLRI